MNMRQLKTKWADNINEKNVLGEYPRPLMRRKSYVNLNGVWKYAIKDTKDFTEFLCCKSREKFVNKTLSIDNNEEFIAPNTEWKEGKILTVKIKEGKWFAFISVDNNSSNVYFDDRAYKGDFNKLLPKVKVRFIQGKNRSNEYFAKQVQILKS